METPTTTTAQPAGPYLDLTAALNPKKPRQKNVTRDGWIARAYNAEMLAKRLESELELERQRVLLLGPKRFFGPEFLAGVLVGALVCRIAATLFS